MKHIIITMCCKSFCVFLLILVAFNYVFITLIYVTDDYGLLYVCADDGYLYCLQTSSTGPADSPWPMFGQNHQRTGRAYDSDNDSLPDYKERQLGTNPESNDSDSDGVLDNYEIVQGSDPLDSNSTLPQAGAPGITVNEGYATQEKIQVLDKASVEIQSVFENATILYTLDGSDPSEGNVYEGIITPVSYTHLTLPTNREV